MSMEEKLSWMEVKKRLLSEGFLEVGDFRIELTLDNTFLEIEYIPRIAVYSKSEDRWYVLRNPIRPGKRLDEGWRNAVDLLEGIVSGKVEPDFGGSEVEKRFVEVIKKNILY